MGSLNKVPSLVQILIAEILCVLCLSSFVCGVLNTIRPGTFGEEMNLHGIGNWVFYLLGFALFAWLLKETFRPKLKTDSWINPKTGSSSGGEYSFCSTHPSYIFADSIVVFFAAFLVWAGWTAQFNVKTFGIMLAIALYFPLSRLFAWYILGLRLTGAEVKKALKPVLFLVIPFYAVFGLIGAMVLKTEIQTRREIAEAPVIDETFDTETFSKLLEASQKEKITKLVKLKSKQISDPMLCQNNEKRDFISVLTALGNGEEVLVVGGDYANLGFKEIKEKAENNKGQIIELLGKLKPMPARSEMKTWFPYCGLEQLPPTKSNRWIFEFYQP